MKFTPESGGSSSAKLELGWSSSPKFAPVGGSAAGVMDGLCDTADEGRPPPKKLALVAKFVLDCIPLYPAGAGATVKLDADWNGGCATGAGVLLVGATS